ncbi:MAG: HEPN domain-containing protein [Methanoregulaceae archaeon]|jgi:HEPN domain-containing protein
MISTWRKRTSLSRDMILQLFFHTRLFQKLLKGIIAMKGERIPKTHYIDELGKSLDLPDTVLDILYDLSVDYQFSRYPDMSDIVPYLHYTETIALRKVENARYTFEFLRDMYSLEPE